MIHRRNAKQFLALSVCALIGGASQSRAAAPAGRYTLSADTVLDTRTQLTWQRAVAPGTYNFSFAGSYCQSLSLGGVSSGWRLPTVKELQSIVDDTASNSAIDGTAFPSTPANPFWASTTTTSTTLGWVVIFSDGHSDSQYSTSANYNVRCVRQGP